MCERLGVTRQGFYPWRKRPPCRRRIVDAAYTAVIKRIHTESRRITAPRICAELADDYNIRCDTKRVARLMRQAGLVGPHSHPVSTKPGQLQRAYQSAYIS